MTKESTTKKFWPALSIASLFACYHLFLYILLALEPGFQIYAAIVISNFVLIFTSLFLEFSGLREKIWKQWKAWPVVAHKIICGVCAFWIGALSLKALLPAIKKDYEKN